MPNHVIHKVEAPEHVIAHAINDKGDFDFRNIVPAPECLEDFQPCRDVVDRAKCAVGAHEFSGPDFMRNLHLHNIMRDVTTPVTPEKKENLLRAISNFFECGYIYWHDFNTKNWGTKWNAYETDTREGVSFQTAWSHPEPIFVALSALFPNDEIVVSYADEDIGQNCRRVVYLGGAVLSSEDLHISGAFQLWHPGVDPATHGYDSNWEYSDELYEKHCG